MSSLVFCVVFLCLSLRRENDIVHSIKSLHSADPQVMSDAILEVDGSP